MEPISNTDRIVLLLRQRLLERAKSGAPSRASRKRPVSERPATGVDNLHALAAVEGIDDHQLGRALIQNILAEQFGTEVLNEAKFQQIVDRVTETLADDAGSAELMSRLLVELRASAR